MMFSLFFEIRLSLPLLVLFLIINIVLKMNIAVETGLFTAGILINRLLCYGTFIFDYKEILMGIIFGRYSKSLTNSLYFVLVAILFTIIFKYKFTVSCKISCFISISIFLLAGFILYFIRPLVFDFIKQSQEYGAEIYLFNSLYFYYYFVSFIMAILIPVNLLSKVIYFNYRKN